MCEQVSQAFDAYLAILREVEKRLKIVLARTAPHWRAKNSCPSCRYKVRYRAVNLSLELTLCTA